MIVLASPRLASLGPRIRQVLLVLGALFVAHDAIYVARYGIGDGYARAMTAQGHDGYWAPASFLLVVGVAVVALLGLAAYRRLRSEAEGIDQPALAEGGSSYLAELAGIWLRLFPTIAVLFAIQENIEHLAVDGHLAGVAPLVGPGSAVVLPVLAATTFVLAAVGAVVRWRIRVLVARIAAAARHRYPRPAAISQPCRWGIVAASIAHRWIVGRRDAGRAPPLRLHAIAALTA
jgi:hypothetical protein